MLHQAPPSSGVFCLWDRWVDLDMNNRIIHFLLLLALTITFLQKNKVFAWGWQTHRYINENAVDYLSPEMEFFQEFKEYLRQHSTDPDTDDLPGYYHYIDIDYYTEFFEETFPHDWDDAVDQYGYDIIIDNGIVPWVIEQWTDSLTILMNDGDWDTVWQLAAELGHYVADSHEPLHLTLNYNGQLTGNYGIHSRYETQMINPHLSELPLPDSTSNYWSSVIDSVFRYIEEIYPYVNEIIAADDLAAAQDPNYNSTYYNILWEELDSLTISVLHCAIIDLASIWQTAWINAGSPTLLSNDEQSIPNVYVLYENYPNPFNPVTTLRYDLPENGHVNITMYDMLGRQVKTLINHTQDAGYRSVIWNATNDYGKPVSAGIYLYQIQTGEFMQTKKMVLLK
jgi:hypothetical protein